MVGSRREGIYLWCGGVRRDLDVDGCVGTACDCGPSAGLHTLAHTQTKQVLA